jgi:cytochrome c
MTWVRRGVGPISALALAASLLLARVHPFGDAGLYGAKAAQAPQPPQASLMDHSSIPPAARGILIAKCADCHSTQTHTPFYGHFAPISWLLERDIVEARKHMNLSQWDTYSADQQQTLIAKIVQQTKSHEMPLPQYRMIHWNSRITNSDIQTFTQWAHNPPLAAADTTAPADSTAATASDGDATRGQAVFEKRCTGCHALDTNREGPRLQGVYGRAAGSVPGFPYSGALRQAHVVWNDQSLEKWLTDPDSFIAATNMDFRVVKPQERKDLISFLQHAGGK